MTAPAPPAARPGAGLLARGGLVRFAAFALLGIIAGLGQEPFGWWWLALPAFALALGLAAGEGRPRTAFADLWSLAFGYFAFTLNWLVEPFFVDVMRSWSAAISVARFG